MALKTACVLQINSQPPPRLSHFGPQSFDTGRRSRTVQRHTNSTCVAVPAANTDGAGGDTLIGRPYLFRDSLPRSALKYLISLLVYGIGAARYAN